VPKPQKHDFSLKLTRVIEPKGGPGVELATLEDAARFMGKMQPFRQRWPHRDYAAELVLTLDMMTASSLKPTISVRPVDREPAACFSPWRARPGAMYYPRQTA
jgi:hypothetical protein